MNNDLLNILSNSNKDIDNQKLMDYLSGKLSDQEKHEVEMWMVDNDFENEALEGLQQMGSNKKLEGYVDQLNKELSTYIKDKKSRREKRGRNARGRQRQKAAQLQGEIRAGKSAEADGGAGIENQGPAAQARRSEIVRA